MPYIILNSQKRNMLLLIIFVVPCVINLYIHIQINTYNNNNVIFRSQNIETYDMRVFFFTYDQETISLNFLSPWLIYMAKFQDSGKSKARILLKGRKSPNQEFRSISVEMYLADVIKCFTEFALELQRKMTLCMNKCIQRK